MDEKNRFVQVVVVNENNVVKIESGSVNGEPMSVPQMNDLNNLLKSEISKQIQSETPEKLSDPTFTKLIGTSEYYVKRTGNKTLEFQDTQGKIIKYNTGTGEIQVNGKVDDSVDILLTIVDLEKVVQIMEMNGQQKAPSVK